MRKLIERRAKTRAKRFRKRDAAAGGAGAAGRAMEVEGEDPSSGVSAKASGMEIVEPAFAPVTSPAVTPAQENPQTTLSPVIGLSFATRVLSRHTKLIASFSSSPATTSSANTLPDSATSPLPPLPPLHALFVCRADLPANATAHLPALCKLSSTAGWLETDSVKGADSLHRVAEGEVRLVGLPVGSEKKLSEAAGGRVSVVGLRSLTPHPHLASLLPPNPSIPWLPSPSTSSPFSQSASTLVPKSQSTLPPTPTTTYISTSVRSLAAPRGDKKAKGPRSREDRERRRVVKVERRGAWRGKKRKKGKHLESGWSRTPCDDRRASGFDIKPEKEIGFFNVHSMFNGGVVVMDEIMWEGNNKKSHVVLGPTALRHNGGRRITASLEPRVTKPESRQMEKLEMSDQAESGPTKVLFEWSDPADKVSVAGDWDGWIIHPLDRNLEGTHAVQIEVKKIGLVKYKYIVDGEWRTKRSEEILNEENFHGPSTSDLTELKTDLETSVEVLISKPEVTDSLQMKVSTERGISDEAGDNDITEIHTGEGSDMLLPFTRNSQKPDLSSELQFFDGERSLEMVETKIAPADETAEPDQNKEPLQIVKVLSMSSASVPDFSKMMGSNPKKRMHKDEVIVQPVLESTTEQAPESAQTLQSSTSSTWGVPEPPSVGSSGWRFGNGGAGTDPANFVETVKTELSAGGLAVTMSGEEMNKSSPAKISHGGADADTSTETMMQIANDRGVPEVATSSSGWATPDPGADKIEATRSETEMGTSDIISVNNGAGANGLGGETRGDSHSSSSAPKATNIQITSTKSDPVTTDWGGSSTGGNAGGWGSSTSASELLNTTAPFKSETQGTGWGGNGGSGSGWGSSASDPPANFQATTGWGASAGGQAAGEHANAGTGLWSIVDKSPEEGAAMLQVLSSGRNNAECQHPAAEQPQEAELPPVQELTEEEAEAIWSEIVVLDKGITPKKAKVEAEKLRQYLLAPRMDYQKLELKLRENNMRFHLIAVDKAIPPSKELVDSRNGRNKRWTGVFTYDRMFIANEGGNTPENLEKLAEAGEPIEREKVKGVFNIPDWQFEKLSFRQQVIAKGGSRGRYPGESGDNGEQSNADTGSGWGSPSRAGSSMVEQSTNAGSAVQSVSSGWAISSGSVDQTSGGGTGGWGSGIASPPRVGGGAAAWGSGTAATETAAVTHGGWEVSAGAAQSESTSGAGSGAQAGAGSGWGSGTQGSGGSSTGGWGSGGGAAVGGGRGSGGGATVGGGWGSGSVTQPSLDQGASGSSASNGWGGWGLIGGSSSGNAGSAVPEPGYDASTGGREVYPGTWGARSGAGFQSSEGGRGGDFSSSGCRKCGQTHEIAIWLMPEFEKLAISGGNALTPQENENQSRIFLRRPLRVGVVERKVTLLASAGMKQQNRLATDVRVAEAIAHASVVVKPDTRAGIARNPTPVALVEVAIVHAIAAAAVGELASIAAKKGTTRGRVTTPLIAQNHDSHGPRGLASGAEARITKCLAAHSLIGASATNVERLGALAYSMSQETARAVATPLMGLHVEATLVVVTARPGAATDEEIPRLQTTATMVAALKSSELSRRMVHRRQNSDDLLDAAAPLLPSTMRKPSSNYGFRLILATAPALVLVMMCSWLLNDDSSSIPKAKRLRHEFRVLNRTFEDHYDWMKYIGTDSDVMAYIAAENLYTEQSFTSRTKELRAKIVAEIQAVESSIILDTSTANCLTSSESASVYWEQGSYSYWSEYAESGYPVFFRRRLPSARPCECSSPPDSHPAEVILDLSDFLPPLQDFFYLGFFEVNTADPSVLAFAIDLVGAERYHVYIYNCTSQYWIVGPPNHSGMAITNSYYSARWLSSGAFHCLYFTTMSETLGVPMGVSRICFTSGESPRVILDAVYEETDITMTVEIDQTNDGRFLVLKIVGQVTTEALVIDVADPSWTVMRLFEREDGVTYDVEHHEGSFVFRSNAGNAENFQVLLVPVEAAISNANLTLGTFLTSQYNTTVVEVLIPNSSSGAYGSLYGPTFDPSIFPLLDRGIAIAICYPRGDGVLGASWYNEGRAENKPNTFSDMRDCVRHLIASGFAAEGRIVVNGRSAGGLIAGWTANHLGFSDVTGAPYVKAIVGDVPFVDPFDELDQSYPWVPFEWAEWGNPREPSGRILDTMVEYSPYHNIAAQPYPSMLVMTGLNDNRVRFFEPLKYVAKLRFHKTNRDCRTGEMSQGCSIILLKVAGSGHLTSEGKSAYEDRAFELTFVIDQLT
ncbi:hypothetical protein HDU93_008727 [Gonapodya sp. JEL0774]|nr:hypothetical protein HDU93_008727 [Gonapodya sp. JEL0774]